MFQHLHLFHQFRLTVAAAAFGLASMCTVSLSHADVIISEVMYNPHGNNQWEYLELFNRGDVDLDLTGYELQRGSNVATIDGGLLPASGVAVLIRSDGSGGRTLEGYQAAWGEDINFLETTDWPGLILGGGTITIRDPAGNTVVQMTYGVEDPWPEAEGATAGGWSLTIGGDPFREDWDAPDNWVQSVEGELGAWRANSPRDNDIGSPGFVIPEPASAALLGMFSGALLLRRAS
ncbi:lamin tail domain-containing protein [Phycisphaerales bacterium AB-hyl4]|uniref:Lamin tail domain-containing protein n=1 Tax=Natronomicrosphaera hydrolytica TaxID=3242702 RepID=A0ABV4U3E7_9BACT